MVQAPAVERGQHIRRQAAPAIRARVNTGVFQEAPKGFVGIAIQLACGLLTTGEHATGMPVAENVRGTRVDAVALERLEQRTAFAAAIRAQLRLQLQALAR